MNRAETAEAIKVMQAWERGEVVQWREKSATMDWVDSVPLESGVCRVLRQPLREVIESIPREDRARDVHFFRVRVGGRVEVDRRIELI